ncbi:hypothetical protein [Nocardia farcinica]|uniref:hypothetical protein n=1 Tax=Nocardia farcinica TaxID=37329 RepID=UPI001E4CBE03|nr:hypothetical protein [Nocardia farcinica]
MEPIAFGWIDHDVSTAPEWDRAQVQRLARGSATAWCGPMNARCCLSWIRRATPGADVVILPGPGHLGPLEVNQLMDFADVEVVLPRLSFARWRYAGAQP